MKLNLYDIFESMDAIERRKKKIEAFDPGRVGQSGMAITLSEIFSNQK